MKMHGISSKKADFYQVKNFEFPLKEEKKEEEEEEESMGEKNDDLTYNLATTKSGSKQNRFK